MNILFENLLDHHPNFVSAPKKLNENDDDEDMDRNSPAKKYEFKEKTIKK